MLKCGSDEKEFLIQKDKTCAGGFHRDIEMLKRFARKLESLGRATGKLRPKPVTMLEERNAWAGHMKRFARDRAATIDRWNPRVAVNARVPEKTGGFFGKFG